MENSGEDITKIIKDIYHACDIGCSDSVCVSKLLEFINSNDTDNLFDFPQLKVMLDPNGLDPIINCDKFVKIVVKWASDNQLTNCNVSAFSERSDFVSEEVFTQSMEDSPEDAIEKCNDLSYNHVDVQELEFKFKHLTEQLEQVKQQLISSEEQNDLLLAENDKLTSKLIKTERIVKKFQDVSRNDDHITELMSTYEKEIHKMSKSLATYEKKVNNLNYTVKKQTEDKDKLELKVKVFNKKVEDQIQYIYNLDVELNNKEKMILSLLESNTQLKSMLKEQDESITHYSEIVNVLKDEKKTLEGSITEYFVEFSYSNVLNNTPKRSNNHLPSTTQTPLATKILSDILKFNSPNLLFNIQNPVSPNIGTPRVNQINNNIQIRAVHSSIISEDDEVFFPSEDEDKNMEIVNLNSVCLGNSLKTLFNTDCRDSLADEIFVADQDFHRNECREIIRKQKLQIVELEDVIKKLNLENREELENQFKIENEELLVKLSEQTKINDYLHHELLLLRKTNKKQGNFSKMEIKLEKKDAKIEELYKKNQNLLNQKQSLKKEFHVVIGNYNELKTLIRNTSKSVAQLKSMHIQLKDDTYDFIHNFKFVIDTLLQDLSKNAMFSVDLVDCTSTVSDIDLLESTSELTELLQESPVDTTLNPNIERSLNNEFCQKITNALMSDLSTVNSNLQTQQAYRDQADESLSDVFKNLKLMFKTVEPYLTKELKSSYIAQIETVKVSCTNSFKAASSYGALLHKQRQLESIKTIVTYTTSLQESCKREIDQCKKFRNEMVRVPKKKNTIVRFKTWYRLIICIFLVFIVFIYMFRYLKCGEVFQSYIKKSYLYTPPT